MRARILDVLRQRRFWPLFATQFFGAGNDNVFKNAVAIFVVYRLAGQTAVPPGVLVNVASGLFILPFFLLSATAGQLADRYGKSGLIRIVKAAEIGIAVLGSVALATSSVAGMLGVLFLLGVHSTFFGPLKYAILPELVAEADLVDANALVEGGTFLAILLGTIAGGLLVLGEHGIATISTILITLACLGLAASLALPAAKPGNPDLTVRWRLWRETKAVLGLARARRDVWLSVLGISWFWLVGILYLAQFPAFAKDVLRGDEHLVTLMLTLFSVGIGVGSGLCSRLLRGIISARFVPAAALAMGLFALDLWLAGSAAGAARSGLPIAPLGELLAQPLGWRVLADLCLLAVAGGVYIVPLYAILQARSLESERARVVAANNIVNAAFMVIGSLAGAGMLALDMSVPQIFLVVAVATLAVAGYICGLLPDTLLKDLTARLLRLLFRVEVSGLEHLEAAGPKAVIVANHVSFLDAVLMAAFMPGRPLFAINTHIAQRWWVRPFLRLVEAFAIEPTNPMSIRGLIRAVEQGRSCVIFPEGRITVTGGLMKIYAGPAMIADKAGAPIVPVRIDGAQYSLFSRLRGKVRRRLLPRITLTVLPAERFELPEEASGRARRLALNLRLYDLMSGMMFATSNAPPTLFSALAGAARRRGRRAQAIEDISRSPVTYGRLLAGALALGRRFERMAAPGEALGLLLPNSAAVAAAFFACQAKGLVPAMLNYTAGPRGVLSACEAAKIRTVVTSRRFVEQARLTALAQALEARVELVYLEDVRDQIGRLDKLAGLLDSYAPGRAARRLAAAPDDPAVILFTSGSEGRPKGVVLSHANILANCRQLAARVAFSPADTFFNALPVFHSFGLTGGLLLPVLAGVKTFLYPSPLHYRVVPEMVYDTNATIMFGADTFMAGYARRGDPYDFRGVRLVFAGAEKVKEQTRRAWMDLFGHRLLEGYGATETAPVLAVNTPMHNKTGSVGRLLPGIEHRIEPVEGVEASPGSRAGRLWVRGPNVMRGYLRAERPGELEPPLGGWYDTGDVVSIDAQGFLTILGRAKRFAKVGGEMVSLAEVEGEIEALWPRGHHAVVALPDGLRGERLVLVTDRPQAGRAEILARFRSHGLPALMAPKAILTVEKMPLLGSGKIDYPAVTALVEAKRERVREG